MSRHAADWTMGRRFADRFGAMRAGKHNPIWGRDIDPWVFTTGPEECKYCREIRLDQLDGLQPTPYGGMEDHAGFAALAKEVSR